jgi:hypothetical protein
VVTDEVSNDEKGGFAAMEEPEPRALDSGKEGRAELLRIRPGKSEQFQGVEPPILCRKTNAKHELLLPLCLSWGIFSLGRRRKEVICGALKELRGGWSLVPQLTAAVNVLRGAACKI